MSDADVALLIGLLVALVVSYRSNRAWGWLLAAAASYTSSTIYWRSGLPGAPLVGGLCDAAVCLAIYFYGQFKWEMWLWRLFQLSVAVNLVYLAGMAGMIASLSHNDFAAILEAINWIALIFIGGTAIFQMTGAPNAFAGRPWDRVRRAMLSLQRERKTPAFHKVR